MELEISKSSEILIFRWIFEIVRYDHFCFEYGIIYFLFIMKSRELCFISDHQVRIFFYQSHFFLVDASNPVVSLT